jgi:sec-independent protein translocase protein TatA
MAANILIGIIGPWQIILIVVVVILLFGGKKIPELMKGIGKGIRDFKDSLNPEEKSKKDNESDRKNE